MNVYVTRDSVAMGDDAYAPHALSFTVPDGTSVEAIVTDLTHRYLASIDGGMATWSVVSNGLLGVTAQQWQRPKISYYLPSQLDVRNGILHLHFNYHRQEDPDTVLNIIRGMRLNAP